MEQNIATSKGCCPSVDGSGNGEKLLEHNRTVQGTSWSGMTRRAGRLRNKHRSQTGIRRCKDQNVIGGPFVVIEEATTLPGWKEISPPKGCPCGRRDSIEGDRVGW